MSEAIQTVDDVVGYLRDVVERLDTLAAVLPSGEERLAEEERRAWDGYAAAYVASEKDADYDRVAGWADGLLNERRKRFGAGKEADVVRVGRGVLERAVDAILEARADGQYEDIVSACRAAMSE